MPKNRGNYLQVHFKPKQNINNMMLEYVIRIPGPKNKMVDFLKQRTDPCKLSSFQSKNPIVSSIFKKLATGDNFPKSCPLKAVSRYILLKS